MSLKEINRKLASLPMQKKIMFLASVVIFLVVFEHFIFLKPKKDKITILENELAKQQKILQENLAICKDMASFEKELEKVRQELTQAQLQLPTEKEIPSLLTKISDQGNLCGLEFELFQPQKEQTKDFYRQLPINMKVLGSYWNVTEFFQLISKLDRIVTVRDFSMRNPKVVDGHITLKTSCQATTYRFQLDDSQNSGGKSGRGKKK